MSVTLFGTCKDSSGKAIPGVSIVEQETGVACQSDAGGNWSMQTLNTLGHTILGIWQGIQLGLGTIAARAEAMPLALVIDPYEGSGVQPLPSTSYFWSGSAKLTGGGGIALPGFAVTVIAFDGQGNMVDSWKGTTDVEGLVSFTQQIDLSQWASIASATFYWRGTYGGRVYAGSYAVASEDSTAQITQSVTYKYDNTNCGTISCF